MKTGSIFSKVFLLACLWTGIFLGLAGYAGGKTYQEDPEVFQKLAEKKNWQIHLGGMSKKFPGNYIETKNLWTFPATAKQIRIKLVSGNVSIKRTSGPEIVVTATGGLNAERAARLIETTQEGDLLSLEEPEHGAKDLNLNIELPLSLMSSFDIGTVSGNIAFENIQAENIVFKAVSGDMILNQVTAENLTYGGVSADLEAENCDIKKVVGKTVSGDIEYESLKTATFDLVTVSGDIKLKIPKSDQARFEMKSISGKITNNHGTNPQGLSEVKLMTTSGDIEIL